MLRSERGRQVAAKLPMDRVLPESDGPFGTNGQEPLWPWEANDVAVSLATAWNLTVRDVQSRLVENFRVLAERTERLAPNQELTAM